MTGAHKLWVMARQIIKEGEKLITKGQFCNLVWSVANNLIENQASVPFSSSNHPKINITFTSSILLPQETQSPPKVLCNMTKILKLILSTKNLLNNDSKHKIKDFQDKSIIKKTKKEKIFSLNSQ